MKTKLYLIGLIACAGAIYAGLRTGTTYANFRTGGKTTAVILDSFTSGQVSPGLEARQTYPKYNSSLRMLENFLISPLGPVQRRPGTRYIATAKTGTPRLLKFEYSTDDVYAQEAGDEYMRFYRDGAQILDGGGDPYEIVTPFEDTELWDIRYAQSDNWQYLVDGTDPPQIITRTAHAAWTCDEIDFEGTGPFSDENKDTGITIRPSGDGETAGYDYYKLNEEASLSVRGVYWYAQTFQASASYTATGVKIKILRVGLPGTVTVSIRATAGGEPTGADLAVGTTDGDTLPSSGSGTWREITFSSTQALTSGTTYAIVIRATGTDATSQIRWRYDVNPSSYDDGAIIITDDSGSTWTIGNADGMFEVVAQGLNSSIITLTASDDLFDAEHVDALWQISHKLESEKISGQFWTLGVADSNSASSLDIYVGQTYTLTTSGYWEGTCFLQRSTDDGTTWQTVKSFFYSFNGNVLYPDRAGYETGIEDKEDATYRVRLEDQLLTSHMKRHDEGKFNFTLATDMFTRRGVVEITAVADANSATATVLTTLASTDATYLWAEGAWSDYRGFPKTVAFHQQRAIYGGSEAYPTTIWFSATGAENYNDFTAGTLDTDSFSVSVQGQNPIRWLLSGDYLMVGTSTSVGKYGKQGLPITPNMPGYQEQSPHGSAPVQAVTTSDTIMYVERGARKIREFGYAFQYDRYMSGDLTTLSEEITDPCVVEIIWQSRPQPTLWCVLGDGDIATLCYYRDQAVAGWSNQNTTGEFKSLVATPGAGTTPSGDTWTEDVLWTVAERTVDGTDYSMIEQFTPRNWGTDVNDCWFVDSGLSTGDDLVGVASTFSGMDHLATEEVCLYGDANNIGSVTVSAGGVITPGGTYTNMTAGLNYTSKLETLPLALPSQFAEARISDRKISALNFDLLNTNYFKYAKGANAALSIADFEDDFVTSVVKFKRLTFVFGSLEKPTIYLETAEPVPCSIRAIIPEVTWYAPN